MSTVTATIDVSKPTGRRIVRELNKHSKIVRLDYPLPNGIAGKGYTLEESYKKGLTKLSEHYGVDFGSL